ncbi:MAG TPA: geranylgeranylglycerol-phosphate geranylgeranyltransferase [Chitinophagaceae bacterium]|nr:geranylgeranylglycerol-phosphate geranylgeranyltransferase [Chitinophagaceae bacterium]HRX93493.1 geranylgeranylglycerol-phosphate geranylgeranyltransferase [Chitinophagaceae bacterium]
MRLIIGFFRLIRLPNLIFIALTQVLFQVCVYQSLAGLPDKWLPETGFILLLFASLFIAAAGYIINDYFDINIDEINKPGKMVVDKVINRRWAIAWHFVLSFAGIVLTVLAVPVLEKWYLIVANIFCVLLLWFYSTRFKKQLLTGNVIISLLTAWTILIIFYSKTGAGFVNQEVNYHRFFRVAFLYAGFAFISSLIREAIKDMEDMPGDAKYKCRTMPIVWGVNTTKVYVAVWLIVLLAILVVVQVYILEFKKWWFAVVFCVLAIIVPLVYIFYKLFGANTVNDFHKLSRWIKLVMLAGILSMIFFYIYL